MEMVLYLAGFFITSSIFGGLMALILIAPESPTAEMFDRQRQNFQKKLRELHHYTDRLKKDLLSKTRELQASRTLLVRSRQSYRNDVLAMKKEIQELRDSILLMKKQQDSLVNKNERGKLPKVVTRVIKELSHS